MRYHITFLARLLCWWYGHKPSEARAGTVEICSCGQCKHVTTCVCERKHYEKLYVDRDWEEALS